MEFPGGNDNYLMITGPSHPFLSGVEDLDHSIGAQYNASAPCSATSDHSAAASPTPSHAKASTTEISNQFTATATSTSGQDCASTHSENADYLSSTTHRKQS
uniref:Uncharacterized protein n=1 Tax=Sus scrofa TaxID=9823 RepID=A0A8D1VSB1_PIG